MSAINTLDELLGVVEETRKERLVIEVELGAPYSPEYEAAKAELDKRKQLKSLSDSGTFLSSGMDEMEAKVSKLKPASRSVWVAFSRLPIKEWSTLVSKGDKMSPNEQYESVLDATFLGIHGQEDAGEDSLLTTEKKYVSPVSDECIVPGGVLNEIITNFMLWQNAGGEVTIHPTK